MRLSRPNSHPPTANFRDPLPPENPRLLPLKSVTLDALKSRSSTAKIRVLTLLKFESPTAKIRDLQGLNPSQSKSNQQSYQNLWQAYSTGISFIALRRLQVYIRLPQSSPPSTVFLPEGPTGSQPPFYESQKLIAWASRTSFFRYLSIPVGYRNHFLGCRRLGYPEGSDSPSIRPSMLANSRRLRWLSANNNQ